MAAGNLSRRDAVEFPARGVNAFRRFFQLPTPCRGPRIPSFNSEDLTLLFSPDSAAFGFRCRSATSFDTLLFVFQ
ncbi:hypothetical protein BgiMline_026563 [Biomphalaria glabrata]|nr:hypothetical protein BgiMline_021032 [Biomphalaria glabrata]